MNPTIQTDWISSLLVARMAATLGVSAPKEGEDLPHLWHWMFFQPALHANDLGRDGHPNTSNTLPEAAGRNRMWAGGRFVFERPLKIGQPAQCISQIEKKVEKQGSTGALLFVTIRHDYSQDGIHCFSEWQDIVYREPAAPKTSSEAAPQAQWSITHKPDATQLFRYSAVTFNGHRIHYDYPYATEIEGYSNLVVHGPMMATWALAGFLQNHPDKIVRSFSFRGVRPNTLPHAVSAQGRLLADNKAQVWISNENGMIQLGEVVYQA